MKQKRLIDRNSLLLDMARHAELGGTENEMWSETYNFIDKPHQVLRDLVKDSRRLHAMLREAGEDV